MDLICDSNRRELLRHRADGVQCAVYLDEYKQSGYPWHWHDEMEIACIEQGSLEIGIHQRKLQLNCGDGIFINAGVLHSYTHIDKMPCRMPNVLFHPIMLYGTEGSVFQKKYIVPLMEAPDISYVVFRQDVPWQKQILEKIRRCYRLGREREYGYEILMRNQYPILHMKD